MILRFLIALIVAAFGATSAHAQCSTAYSKGALNTQVLADFPNQTSGQITPLTMQTFLPNMIASFQQYPGVNAQINRTYTVALSDYGQLITFNNSSPVAVTLAAASTTGFCPFGFYVSNLGVGTATITPLGGTIAQGANLSLTTNQAAMVFSDGSNWQVLKFAIGGGGGGGTVDSGTTNSLGYYAADGNTISGLTACPSGVYATSNLGAPSCATTLPPSLTIPGPTFTGTVIGPDGGSWSSSGFTASNLATLGTITFGILSSASLGTSPTTISGLTTNNSPDLSNDYIPYYSAGTNSIEKATIGAIASSATSGVSSLDGLVGVLQIANGGAVNVTAVTTTPTFVGLTIQVAVTPPQGRLTLQSNTPVMTTTQANKATLYYDCFNGGNTVPYWNGTVDTLDTVTGCEVSTAMQASSTGVLGASGVFDVWWEGNTHHNICIATNGSGSGWNGDSGSNTVRGTGYSALDYTTRPYITNANLITHCYNGATDYGGSLSNNKLTYLGTIYTTAAGQTSWQYATNGGVQGIFGVWNAYNRVTVATGAYAPNLSSWSVTGALRQWAGLGLTTGHLQIVQGLNQDPVNVRAVEYMELSTPSAINTACNVYIGLDSSTAIATNSIGGNGNSAGSQINFNVTAYLNRTIGLGVHNIWGLDLAVGQICPTVNTTSGTGSLTGIFATLRM